jgi:uroporphyrinogen-III decarboxylase
MRGPPSGSFNSGWEVKVMFTPPGSWDSLSADEKYEARFASWMSTEELAFDSAEAEATYKRRTQRVKDIVELKKPDRVPLLPWIGSYFADYAGFTQHDIMYDVQAYSEAWSTFIEDFRPDYLVFAGYANPGEVFDLLDYKVYHWPGHGVDENTSFQCVEDDYMRPDEYDQLIADPESYYMRQYMPRAFGALEGWQMLPSFYASMELPIVPALVAPVGIPQVQESFKAFLEAGEKALAYSAVVGETDAKLRAAFGMPPLPGGVTKAPFDIIGDTLRGTRGIMLDMYRRPEKVLAACERLVPIAVQLAVQTATAQNNPFVFIPLHKGADSFMSRDDFRKFYWPSFKAVLLGLIEEGLVPYHLVEGAYNQRLDIIADPDIPAGRTYWSFDQTDMKAAKEALGGWACIAGNVPASMLHSGTPEQVENYVKELIDTVGQDGGYAVSNGAVLEHARAENVHAMFEACRKYGVYD